MGLYMTLLFKIHIFKFNIMGLYMTLLIKILFCVTFYIFIIAGTEPSSEGRSRLWFLGASEECG